MFSNSHIVFKIQTRPFKYECERRFSDFLWLRTILLREYPACYIPPMPSKDGKRNFDDGYLNRRMAYLQFFIDGICAHRELRSSEYFLQFLKIASADQWKSIKNTLDKKLTNVSGFRDGVSKKFTGQVKTDLRAFSNLDGDVTSRISLKMKDYSTALDELVNQIGPLTDR